MKNVITAEAEKNWLKHPDKIVSFSHTFKTSDVATADSDGKKILKSGTIYPSNDANAIGIVFNDIDVTNGDVAGSLMVHGDVLEKALPQTITATAKKALIDAGIYFYADNGETLVTPSGGAGS